MRNINQNVLSAVDTASQTGGKIDASQLYSASFHAYFGDSGCTGSVKIQASNDPCAFGNDAVNFTPTNWVDIPNTSTNVTSGGAILITLSQLSYRWLRVAFTYASGGSSTINVNLNALGF